MRADFTSPVTANQLQREPKPLCRPLLHRIVSRGYFLRYYVRCEALLVSQRHFGPRTIVRDLQPHNSGVYMYPDPQAHKV